MRYLYFLLALIAGLFPFSTLSAQTGLNTAGTKLSGTGGQASTVVGQVFYSTADACGGNVQVGVLQPAPPLLDRQIRFEATEKD